MKIGRSCIFLMIVCVSIHEIQGADMFPLETGPTFKYQSIFQKCHCISCLCPRLCLMATGEKKKRTDLSSLPIRLETEHIWFKKDSELLPWAAAVLSPLPCNSHSLCAAAAQAGAPVGAAGRTSHHRGLQTSKPAWAMCWWKHSWAGRKEGFYGKDKPFCSLLPKLRSCKFLAGWALGLFCARQGYSGIRPGIQ